MAEILGPFRSPHDINDIGPYPRSLLELRMHALSAAIRRKPDWHIKRLNPDIVARWKEAALALHFTPAQFQVIFDELECYDKLRSGCIEVADVDGVWKAPCLIPGALAAQFSRLVDRLSNIPDGENDWHPGSDEKVLDLIHPGLYLLVSGFTRTVDLNQPGPSNGVPIHADLTKFFESDVKYGVKYDFFSLKYQWIPTPVEVDANNKVRFLSYINNLHPKHHSALYDVLSDILATTLPLFERTLGFLKTSRRPKINLRTFKVYHDDNNESPRQGEWEDNEAFRERQETYWENRPRKSIPVEDYKSISETPPITLGGRKLQVLIKIQEIHLTPDKPSYDGEVWHVDGMTNEAIVASAIYCYHCTNVSDCTLSFQEIVCSPNFAENERGVEEVYGFVNGGQLVQELGSVTIEVHLHISSF